MPPLSPRAIMCVERSEAPALVPATTMPAAWRRRIAAASAVPPRAEERRSWLPPVMKRPVANSRRSKMSGSAASASSRVRTLSTSTVASGWSS